MTRPAPSSRRTASCGPPRPAAGPVLDADQQRSSTTRAARCWCSPARAPARPRRWSRRSSTGGSRTARRPDSVLALTFCRKAAEQLRDRVTARLGRTLGDDVASTFHSFAYGLIRAATRPRTLYAEPLRLLSARRSRTSCSASCSADARSRSAGPTGCGARWAPAASPREVHAVLARAREQGLDADDLRRGSASSTDRPECVAAGPVPRAVPHHPRRPGRPRLRRPDPPGGRWWRERAPAPTLRERFRHVFVDEYQDTDPGQVALLRALAGDGRDLVVVGDPDQSIYASAAPRCAASSTSRPTSRTADGAPAPTSSRCGPPAASARACCAASQRVAGRRSLPRRRRSPPTRSRAFREPRAVDARARCRAASRCCTFDTARAEAEHIADLLRRAHLEDGVAWSRHGGAGPLRPRLDPGAAPGAARPPGCRSRSPRDEIPLVQEPAVQPLLDALRAVVDLDDDRPRSDPDYVDAEPGRRRCCSPARRPRRRRRPGARPAAAPREKAAAAAEDRPPRPSARPAPRGGRSTPELLDGPDRPRRGRRSKARRLGRAAARGARTASTAEARPPRRCCGRCGPAPTGPTGCARRRRRAAPARARGAPRPRRRLRALRRGGPRRRSSAATPASPSFLDDPVGPADPRRHAGRARRARRRGPAADRPPVQGPGVAAGRGRPRAGGRLARPAPPRRRCCAPTGSAPTALRAAGRRPARCSPRSAGSSTSPAPGPASGWWSPRSPRPTTTASSRRGSSTSSASSRRADRQGRPRRPLSLAGLVAELRRTAADDRDAPSRCATPPRAGSPGSPGEHRDGRPLVPAADPATWWGTRARDRVRRSRSRPPTSRSRSAPAPSTALLHLPGAVVPRARGRRASGRPRQAQGFGNIVHALADRVGRGRARRADPRRGDLMGHVDDGLGASCRSAPPGRARRERERGRGPRSTGSSTGTAGPTRARVLGTERRLQRRGRPARRARRCGCTGTPTGSSSTPRAGSWSSTSRPASTPRPTTTSPSTPSSASTSSPSTHGAADELVGPPAPSPGAPSWSSCARRPAATPRCSARRPQAAGRDRRRAVERQLIDAVGAVRDEEFPAPRRARTASTATSSALCPAKSAGTVLS